MGAANRLLLFVLDHKGQIGRLVVYVAAAVLDPSGAAVQAIKNAINALSEGVVTKEGITQQVAIESALAAVATGGHDDIDDRIRLTFRDGDGQYHRYEIPSPAMSNFDTTDTTVLGPATQVPTPPYFAVANSIETYCEAPSGAALSFVEATYYRRRGDIA